MTTRAGRQVRPTKKALGRSAHAQPNGGDIDDEEDISCFVARHKDSIPSTIAQAKESPEWSQWEKAIDHELASH